MEARRACRGWIAGLVALMVLLVASGARAQTYTASQVVLRDGNPTLLVDGRPFFFYGAAFFYERIPAPQWRASMLALRAMGFNTLDLYVPWNWHELADGDFDFDGHTNPRRNLRAVVSLARELHFKLIVRPGPVIRNEWRNGGYPAWLLTRPEYGMPLHDILEGRYPATATLQNANSDDAAAQWLANATHIRYASRWLRTVMHEFDRVSDLVVAVQLDDDQGAYIDNQTWPAPHLQTYLRTLEAVVRTVVGPRLPVYINTYEMKVTASAPVWAMGNWYQSDAYSIGEHDRAALEVSAGLLQTQRHFPLAMSEFQAGWLAQPEDPAPRPADPTNTTLALHTLLGLGMRGVIDFPAQDTISPAGWEAPFANASYAWDAALDVDLRPSPRYAPTKRFGDIVRAHGAELAQTRRVADGAIAYLTSAYDETRLTNADVFAIVARTQAAQQACRVRHLTCDLVDLRFIDDAALRRYPFVIVPHGVIALPLGVIANTRLARYQAGGGRVMAGPPDVVTPRSGGIADATVLAARDGATFIDIVNYDAFAHAIPATHVRLPAGGDWTIGPLSVPPRDALLLYHSPPTASVTTREPDRGVAAPVVAATVAAAVAAGVPSPARSRPESERTPGCAAPVARAGAGPGKPQLIEDDRAQDGYPRLTLANDLVSVTLAPDAGARAFTFAAIADGCAGENIFTTVGALRDDVAIAPPLSTSDRIGKYTRSFPAGFFNRSYSIENRTINARDASLSLAYDAPDVVPNGAHIERTMTITADEPGFTVLQRVTFGDGPGAQRQRAVRYDSFAALGATFIDDRTDGAVGWYYPAAARIAIAAWPLADVEDARIIPERTSTVLRLQFASGGERMTRYALAPATSLDAARAALLKERTNLEAKRSIGVTGAWRNGRRSCLKSNRV